MSWDILIRRIALLCLVFSPACGGDERQREDAGIDAEAETDADSNGDGDLSPPDADEAGGDADVDADADTDADADADSDADADEETGPLRRLVERPLFGEMPLDNRVYDPGFSLLDGTGWSAMGNSYWDFGQVSRRFLPSSPMGSPVLFVPYADNPRGIRATGSIKSTSGPVVVSVWLGRRVGDDDPDLDEAEASLLGLFPGGSSDEAIDLVRDDETAALELSGITWRRFTAIIPDGPIGWANLSISEHDRADLYIAAPLFLPDDGTDAPALRGSGAPSAISRRALTTEERSHLQAVRELMYDRFSP